MSFTTIPLFQEDAYLSTAEGTVVSINEQNGIIFDRTCFYATSGGQPGDCGFLERSDGTQIPIATTVNGANKQEIIHVPEDGAPLPDVGETLIQHIDWERRHKLMRMHTALHLLTVVAPYPITGAAVSDSVSRVDFDVAEPMDKTEVTAALMKLVTANHRVYSRWITDEELEANPGLVKSKNVRPPKGQGRVRLVCIGDEGVIDTQPCGGTHVSETAEIGDIHISKIEKKGKQNRRFRVAFGSPSA
ncbi:MAG: alanyl-tRNA editing protein [Pseudomonadota bacterium]